MSDTETSNDTELAAKLAGILDSLQSLPITHGAAVDLDTFRELCDEAGTQTDVISLPGGTDGLPDDIPIIIDRKAGNPKSLKALAEEWRMFPARKKGTAKVTTLESFVALTNRHKTEHSALFAITDWKKPSFTSVIDYHDVSSGGLADNGTHRIHYEFPQSEEWKVWVAMDGKPLTQTEFAEFLEDHIGELAAPHDEEITFWEAKLGGKVAYPNAIKMLSIGLKIHAETRVTNNVTLQSGEGQISWEEEHRTATGEKLIVPSLFIIQLPPFFLGETIRVPVRLRYRVAAGSVTWIFKMYRPETFITEQINRDFERAAYDIGLPGFQGYPEMTGLPGPV